MAIVRIDSGEGSLTAPDFTLRDTQGRDLRLSDYRGRPVVLVFTRGFR